jgi:hypothetical protein
MRVSLQLGEGRRGDGALPPRTTHSVHAQLLGRSWQALSHGGCLGHALELSTVALRNGEGLSPGQHLGDGGGAPSNHNGLADGQAAGRQAGGRQTCRLGGQGGKSKPMKSQRARAPVATGMWSCQLSFRAGTGRLAAAALQPRHTAPLSQCRAGEATGSTHTHVLPT